MLRCITHAYVRHRAPSLLGSLPSNPVRCSAPSSSLWDIQVRHAGRLGGCKRRRKSSYSKTPQQSGELGKRMEFFWPKKSHRRRIPLWENSRQHVVYDARLRKWMTMWYKSGIQVFQTFSARNRSEKFERSRMKAIVLFQQLQNAKKLGSPGPERGRGGIRGVSFDQKEQSWIARWTESGLQRHKIYPIKEYGFHNAYKHAAKERLVNMEKNHMFQVHRSRLKGYRHPYGTTKT